MLLLRLLSLLTRLRLLLRFVGASAEHAAASVGRCRRRLPGGRRHTRAPWRGGRRRHQLLQQLRRGLFPGLRNDLLLLWWHVEPVATLRRLLLHVAQRTIGAGLGGAMAPLGPLRARGRRQRRRCIRRCGRRGRRWRRGRRGGGPRPRPVRSVNGRHRTLAQRSRRQLSTVALGRGRSGRLGRAHWLARIFGGHVRCAIVEGQFVELQQIVHGPAVLLLLLCRQRRLRCRRLGGGGGGVVAAAVCRSAVAAGVLMVVVLIGMVYRLRVQDTGVSKTCNDRHMVADLRDARPPSECRMLGRRAEDMPTPYRCIATITCRARITHVHESNPHTDTNRDVYLYSRLSLSLCAQQTNKHHTFARAQYIESNFALMSCDYHDLWQ